MNSEEKLKLPLINIQPQLQFIVMTINTPLINSQLMESLQGINQSF